MDVPSFLAGVIRRDLESHSKNTGKQFRTATSILKGTGGFLGLASWVVDAFKFANGGSSLERIIAQTLITATGMKYPVAGLGMSLGDTFFGDKIESKIRDRNKAEMEMRSQFFQSIGSPSLNIFR